MSIGDTHHISPAIVVTMAVTACVITCWCSASTDWSRASAARIASAFAGTVLFASAYGRGQFGDDRRAHTAQLIGLGRNPNVAAIDRRRRRSSGHRRNRARDRSRRKTGRHHCARRCPRGRAGACPARYPARGGAGTRRVTGNAAKRLRLRALFLAVECGPLRCDVRTGVESARGQRSSID